MLSPPEKLFAFVCLTIINAHNNKETEFVLKSFEYGLDHLDFAEHSSLDILRTLNYFAKKALGILFLKKINWKRLKKTVISEFFALTLV